MERYWEETKVEVKNENSNVGKSSLGRKRPETAGEAGSPKAQKLEIKFLRKGIGITKFSKGNWIKHHWYSLRARGRKGQPSEIQSGRGKTDLASLGAWKRVAMEETFRVVSSGLILSCGGQGGGVFHQVPF